MMYEMVVQNIAISVPLGMATVGFWEAGHKRNSCKAFQKTIVLYISTYVNQGLCAGTGRCLSRWERCMMLSKEGLYKTRIRQRDIKKGMYLQVPRDVSSCQDARGGGEEDGEHAKEAALLPSPVGHKIGGKNIRCWNREVVRLLESSLEFYATEIISKWFISDIC